MDVGNAVMVGWDVFNEIGALVMGTMGVGAFISVGEIGIVFIGAFDGGSVNGGIVNGELVVVIGAIVGMALDGTLVV